MLVIDTQCVWCDFFWRNCTLDEWGGENWLGSLTMVWHDPMEAIDSHALDGLPANGGQW